MYRRILSVSLLLIFVLLGVGVASAQSSPALWFVSYWDNTNLSGQPIHKSSEGIIDHNWGDGSPGGGVPKDGWSAQWTAMVDFQAGTYRFSVTNDDGARVYVGDKHIIVDWSEHPKRTSVATVSLNGGRYPMAVDYFDKKGSAVLQLGWQRIGPARAGAADVTILSSGLSSPTPNPAPVGQGIWYGRFWNNTTLSGTPAATQNVGAVNFEWGNGRPHGSVNYDYWSASWTTQMYFAPGTYRFTSVSDDGIRVYVHDRHVINNWTTHARTVDSGTIDLAGGTYVLQIDYFDATGEAVARVGWERVNGYLPPVAVGGPITATPVTWLRLRGGPGTVYQILSVAPPNAIVNVIGRTANARWLQVEYRGMIGWMGAGYLRVYGDVGALPITG